MWGPGKGRKGSAGATGRTPVADGGAWVASDPGQTGGPGLGWPPPPGGTGPGGWATGGGPAWTQPAKPRRRRGLLPAAAFVSLAVVAAAAGLGIGHEVWPAAASVSTASEGGTASPNNAGSGASSGPGGSSSGQSPFGSGGSSFGQSPVGSGGSSFGQSPFGSGGSSGGSAAEGSGGPSDVGSIAAGVDPALVDINSTFSYQSAQGAGTGIVLTSTGEILTNNHVIDGATKISVTDIGNGKSYSASVVGYDAAHDIAVLQLQGASGLQTAKLGDSSTASVGESVVAIGNAGGTGGTPTSAGGSITALNQSITAGDDLGGTSEQLSGLIQVNADIQAGDSGGSLVDSAGQVVGMDTAASTSSGSFMQSSGNQGFAIPINEALSTASQIESGQGSATAHVGATAFLGVLISPPGEQTGPAATRAMVQGHSAGRVPRARPSAASSTGAPPNRPALPPGI